MLLTLKHIDIVADRQRGRHLVCNEEGAEQELADWLKEYGNTDLTVRIIPGKDMLVKLKTDAQNESQRLTRELNPQLNIAHEATAWLDRFHPPKDDDA